MALSIVHSRAIVGIEAVPVQVEVHIANGLPAFNIVGMPETAVKEARERVRAAIINSGFEFPAKRITVNLAPAELPKVGGRYDMPIAIALLHASSQLPEATLERWEMHGELALSGDFRGCDAGFSVGLAARSAGAKIAIPACDTESLRLVSGVEAYAFKNLSHACAHLSGCEVEEALVFEQDLIDLSKSELDFAEVHGQSAAKRALLVAASGGHSVLMIGPPGVGKTMLAARFNTLFPRLDEKSATEVAQVWSSHANGFIPDLWRKRPFRQPHHSSSAVALIGGGAIPKPGEVSLAHRGVLFLDELPEFQRNALESLREPLESGEVHIARAAAHITFPSEFQLISAMNPCPCGFLGDGTDRCNCTPDRVRNYRNKISGPLMDRIDLHIHLNAISSKILNSRSPVRSESTELRSRVVNAHRLQKQRQGKLNSSLHGVRFEECCELDAAGRQLLNTACDRLHLSSRANVRIRKLARTIADLDHEHAIKKEHLAEAVGYRLLDRQI
ncbi:MAG TPA: ATP-dependent protease [Gammaproteobacteria bacterium]|nr:ATP-dependent protease [Gammaproteobacteria bacterium]